MGGAARGAHGVHAADGAADQAPSLGIELVHDAPAHLRKHAVEDPVDLAERGPGAEVERRHHRKLGRRQLGEERVLVENRRLRPAARAMELDDQAALVLQLHLVDAVLERAQGQAAARAAQTADLDRVEHAVGGETEERRARLAQVIDFPASTIRVVPVMNDDSAHERNRMG